MLREPQNRCARHTSHTPISDVHRYVRESLYLLLALALENTGWWPNPAQIHTSLISGLQEPANRVMQMGPGPRPILLPFPSGDFPH